MRKYEIARPFNFFENLDQFFEPQFKNELRWKPLSRVHEKESHYHLALDIPGVDKEHLRVELKDNILKISGERKDLYQSQEQKIESFGQFEQQFSLPKEANLDEIEVNHHNGVLDIVIPKIQKNKEHKSLEIKSGINSFLTK